MTLASKYQRSQFRVLIGLLILMGVAARLLPLLDHQGRLLQQFPTEDGYLMLQIARNMALNYGMSVSAGTIETNGTQPFCTFIWSLFFRLVDGDRIQGVALALIWQTLIAILSGIVTFRIGRIVLGHQSRSTTISALAAASWFSSTVSVPHTMNCLETGTYVLAVLLAIWLFLVYSLRFGSRWPMNANLILGAVLGWTFWVRNDAVFLILAVCLTKTIVGKKNIWRAFSEACQIGVTSILIAMPWLYNNYTRFGAVMPISGHSQSYAAPFGYCAHLIPPTLIEYLATFLPIPQAWTAHPVILWSTFIMLLLSIAWLIHSFRCNDEPVYRTAIVLVVIYALGLCGYYGTSTAASHFIGRYLFPLSPFAALLGFSFLATLSWNGNSVWRAGKAACAASILMVVTIAALHVRLYHLGSRHQHFQVVEWVQSHVDDQTWVGAIQSGTLGYFHDRTYNLDGKVSPEALRAKQQGRIPSYVIEKQIGHLVDWYGISEWAKTHPEIKAHFRVEVADRDRNLAVLTRRSFPK